MAKSFSGLIGAAKASKRLSQKGKIPKSCRASAMDAAKAMGILGFTSTRWLDYSSGNTPKQELDNAHFKKMMEIHKKKRSTKGVHAIHKSQGTLKINFLIGRRKAHLWLQKESFEC